MLLCKRIFVADKLQITCILSDKAQQMVTEILIPGLFFIASEFGNKLIFNSEII